MLLAKCCFSVIWYLSAVFQYCTTRLVAEWLACWTRAQKGPGSNRNRDAVGQHSQAN